MALGNMHTKLGEVRPQSFRVMQVDRNFGRTDGCTDRQTDRQTEKLITILHNNNREK